MEVKAEAPDQLAGGRSLSRLASRFVEETTRGGQSRTTTLAKVRTWLGDKANAALVVLAELEAAGHVQLLKPHSDWRLRVRARPVAMGEASGQFRLAVRIMASKTLAADQVHGPTWPSCTVYWRDRAVVRLADGAVPAEWISVHRGALMVMLTAAAERGWHDLALPFAEALGRMWSVSNHHQDALRAVAIAREACDRLHMPVISSLRSLNARTLSELDDHHRAEFEATVALVCAQHSGDAMAIVTAYACRGWVRERAGRPAAALDDFEQAALAARDAGMADVATEQGTLAEASVATIERLETAVTVVERAAGLLNSPSVSINHGHMLNALSDALGYAQHSPSVHQRVARALKVLLQDISSDKEADIQLIRARNAEAAGQLVDARDYYQHAMTAYAAAGQPAQAQVIQTMLDELDQRDQSDERGG